MEYRREHRPTMKQEPFTALTEISWEGFSKRLMESQRCLLKQFSIMESLLVHARRVMRTKLENTDETVGHVFNYEWED